MSLRRRVLLITALACLALAAPAGREQACAQIPGMRGAGQTDGKTGTAPDEELARLRKLRMEDPEAFRREIEARRRRLHQYLLLLRQSDPEAYDRALTKLQEYRQRRLHRLRDANPEAFVDVMGRRRRHIQERLAELQRRDPARYEQLMQRWEQLRAMPPGQRRLWLYRNRARRRPGMNR